MLAIQRFGPLDNAELGVTELQTLPGWEIYLRPENINLGDGLVHVYRAAGLIDAYSRWIFHWVGGFTPEAFKARQRFLEYKEGE